MRQSRIPWGVLVVAIATLAGGFEVVPMAGGTQTVEPPRTPWGDPDLQGVWSYASLTPLQRPPDAEGQEFFSAEEAAARNAATQVDRPPPAGSPGTYNTFWYDRGQLLPDRRTSLIVDPSDGRLPLTTAARVQLERAQRYRQARPADTWLDRSNWDRCITYHGVPPVSTGYNNTYQILQTADHVAIRVENIHDVRIIPLDRRPPLDDRIRQWNGDSRGYWEGDTLVVETGNYSEDTQLRFPSSRHTRAVERFTRVSRDVIEKERTSRTAPRSTR